MRLAQERRALKWFQRKRPSAKLKDFRHYPVTAGTIAMSIAISIAWWSHADISFLFESAEIRYGELWRLITCVFPHVGFWHLAFNLYWLWIFGTCIEGIYGHSKTLLLFLLFAVGSSSLQFAFTQGGVGLSGVGYGLFGMLWILSRRDDRFRDAVDPSTILTFLVWFALCIAMTISKQYSVGNVAHGAGLILGLLVGAMFTYPEHSKLLKASIIVITTFGLLSATFLRPLVNHSKYAGVEEANWGYEALLAHRDRVATWWLSNAALYHLDDAKVLLNLSIAYQRRGHINQANFFRHEACEANPLICLTETGK